MKPITRILTVTLTLALCAGALTLFPAAVTDQDKPGAIMPEVYQQTDERWGDKELIAPNGCGLLSLVNAVNYLTGNFIDPVELAVYAHKIDAYNGSVGGGTARWVLYHQLDKYEKKYGFKVVQTGKDAGVTHKDFIKHLEGGGVAVCHVSGHFIAIVGYNAKDKTYLVYDSAANPDRRNTTAAPTWLSAKYLTTSQYMTVDWWCLISATEYSENSVGGVTYTDQVVPAFIRVAGDETVTLEGTVLTSRGVTSLCYILDYDYDHVIDLPAEVKADADVRKSFSVDVALSGLEMGQHTLRLVAKTSSGGVSDIAEYAVVVHDGSDYVDPATGDVFMGMSGFLGQTDVVKHMATTGSDAPVFRAAPGDVLYIGNYDLSKYKTCVVEYSTRNTFVVDKEGVTGIVGLKSARVTYGSGSAGYDLTGSLAYADMTQPAAGEGGLDSFREAVIDLEGVDRNGPLFLSLYNPTKDAVIVRSIRFLTGVEPATEAPTEVPTEAPTEAEATADSTAATEAVTEPSSGCRSSLPALLLPLLLAAAYVMNKKK